MQIERLINMTKWERFRKTVFDGIIKGEIKTSKPLTELDIAVQFCVGEIGSRKGYQTTITLDDIFAEMQSHGIDMDSLAN